MADNQVSVVSQDEKKIIEKMSSGIIQLKSGYRKHAVNMENDKKLVINISGLIYMTHDILGDEQNKKYNKVFITVYECCTYIYSEQMEEITECFFSESLKEEKNMLESAYRQLIFEIATYFFRVKILGFGDENIDKIIAEISQKLAN